MRMRLQNVESNRDKLKVVWMDGGDERWGMHVKGT